VLTRETLEGFLDDIGVEVFPTLVDTYLAETRTRVDTLEEHFDTGALDVVERHAHDIKSCAGTLGAEAVRDHAARLEHAARDSDDAVVREELPKVLHAARVAYPAIEAGRDTLFR
jgi:HPt (histidine-containing phosphotransfer) domain-containing protein